MADVALGAVSLVLGFIRDEARLLRGVRGDVQFIMDEMESMNDLLRQLVMSRRRSCSYQFRPWMKQVMELAFDSRNCVELYMQSTGHVAAATPPSGRNGRHHESFQACLRRVSWLPWAIIARHQVVERIRELKVRAREIGERQSRYGVVGLLPQLQAQQDQGSTSRASEAPQAHSDGESGILMDDGTPELLQWLDQESEAAQAQLSVTAVIAEDGTYGATVADAVYEHYKSSSTRFQFVIRIAIRRPPIHDEVLLDILHGTGDTSNWEDDLESNQTALRQWLRFTLSGKKLLLLISHLDYQEIWDMIKEELNFSSISPGSAVVSFTKDASGASICNPTKTISCSIVDVYLKKLDTSLPFAHEDNNNCMQVVRWILQKCSPDEDCMDLLHHALHNNTCWPELELKRLLEELGQHQSPTEKYKKIVAFCYETLPNECKNCLWYSTTFFTKGRQSPTIPRKRLLRRWVAQGLITQEDGMRGAMDKAEHYFDILLTQKLLLPREKGRTGRIKSCAVHPTVIDMIDKESPTVEDLLLNNQVPLDGLDLLFSLRDGVLLHRSKSIMESLKSLPTSSRMLLTVLDLEGREGLKMHHLRDICRMRKLKYLSLRNTDVTQLPKQIDELKLLETLDIRQTRVKRLDVVLPMLRHLLAGSVHCPSEDTVKSKESFSTVRIPGGIDIMDKLEILSYVKVSDSAKELINLGDKLKQLKKLGIVLSGKNKNLKYLFIQIDKLHKCLRSLSIRMEQTEYWDEIDAILLRPPKLLESLNICGIKSGLPPRIKELHQLAKITLRDTYLKEDALNILGMLKCLCCLRLRHHSFAEGDLTFTDGKFGTLILLEIEDDIVTRVNFASGTANKLNKITWSFSHMESLSGIRNLMSLTKLELNQGISDTNGLQKLKDDIAAHHNHIDFYLGSVENGQGSGDRHSAR